MKQSNPRRGLLLAAGLLVLVAVLVGGAAATVLAYRQVSGQSESVTVSRGAGTDQSQGKIDKLSDQPGVLIADVDPDSPAASAGLERGSIILAVDGVEVNSPADLREAINEHEAGDVITLSVKFGEDTRELDITLASAGPYLGVDVARPGLGEIRPFQGDGEFHPRPGFRFHFDGEELPFDGMPFDPHHLDPGLMPDLDPEMLEEMATSVVVAVVEPGTPADEVGLEPGDIISAVDDEEIDRTDQLADLIGSKKAGDTVNLTVTRGEETFHFEVTLAEHPEDANRGYLGVHLGFAGLFHYREMLEQAPDSQLG